MYISKFGIFSIDVKPAVKPNAPITQKKGIENIKLVDINPEDSHAYYRKDGIHYVPKLKIDDLILK